MVRHLSIARQYQYATRLEIPKIKHAPTSLAASLEDYLNDADFEVNRRQYLAKQGAKSYSKLTKGTGKTVNKVSQAASKPSVATTSTPSEPKKPQKQEEKGPAPDLIDFFESIEQNQQTMAQPQYVTQMQPQGQLSQIPSNLPMQNTGAVPQVSGYQQPAFISTFNASNPFYQHQLQSIQPSLTGTGFGGAASQSFMFSAGQSNVGTTFQGNSSVNLHNSAHQIPMQNSTTQQVLPQTTNPFRQSMMPNALNVSSLSNNSSNQRQSTNPFTRQDTSLPQISTLSAPTFQPNNAIPFQSTAASSIMTSPYSSQSQAQNQPINPTLTGSNPFARSAPRTDIGAVTSNIISGHQQQQQQQQQQPGPQTSSLLIPNPTGSTNPFRKSVMMNSQNPSQGWQSAAQGTMGGFEQLDTIPVFPRPGQSAL